MIKTVPQSTVSPQMRCINGIKGWFTRTQICWQDFAKLTCRTQKIRPNFFPGLIYGDQEPLWLLNVIEDDCQLFGEHSGLSTRSKIWFTLGLFANHFSLKSLSVSHEL